jgi:transcription-repair coupling factor (superfamily II helicase)
LHPENESAILHRCMRLPGHSIADLVETIRNARGRVNCTGLAGAAQAYVLYQLHRKLQLPLFVLCPTAKEAERLEDDILFFAGKAKIKTVNFPAYDILPFKPLAYHPETSCRRIGALYEMMTASEPPVIITTVSALLPRVIPKQALSQCTEFLLPGEESDRDELAHRLIQAGYQEAVLVEEPGDFAVRGALIDVFPPLYPDPVRIEFFGDNVESIRTFSAQDQLSVKALSEVVILPACETVLKSSDVDRIAERILHRGQTLEMPGLRLDETIDRVKNFEQFPGIGGLMPLIFPSTDILLNYVPPRALFVLIDSPAIEQAAIEQRDLLGRNYLEAAEEGRLCVEPETLFLPWSEADLHIRQRPHLTFNTLPATDVSVETCSLAVEDNYLVAHELRARTEPDALLKPLATWVGQAGAHNLAVCLVSKTVKQGKLLEELLSPYGLNLGHTDAFPSKPKANTGPIICIGALSAGFVWAQEGVAIITDEEIFGTRHHLPKTAGKKTKTAWLTFEELKSGDWVVHEDHGVGQYGGLVRFDAGGLTNDYLMIAYQDGDKLYVPVDRMNSVQKYVGVDGVIPRLDKMGGKSWGRVKERVKKSIRKMAGELLKLYAWRKVQTGHAFSPQDQHFREFEAAFQYTETPDQIRAVEDVINDMESLTPMDRLICGDVGYGKTEIALRAAFKAVWDNKQVAFLVPTTVLAEQHHQTFKERFQAYPVHIETLSRFRPAAHQRNVLQRLRDGQVDIVIGTHRLLQKDIEFKDLGLVIVDEEQRFGVAHKEKLKQLRRTVDYLALTATPIPRTLHMSLMGIRDLSIISTPPEYRYPIKTYVSVLDDNVIAEAIHREMQRGGQMFFVHNNIRTIWAMARRIQGLIPGIRVGVAHGQLDDEELEKAMLQFLYHEIDCLMCTTIIESGLDFPSANTILINRADKLGLAQIYQLRGRVGRGDEQAYAYLFIPHENALTRHAQKRLKVLMEHSDLGSGFQIAMSDLQIRGSGTILGPTQSGQIASVGHEMYLQLMERTMAELKGEPLEAAIEPEIVANLSAYIPENYVSHIDQRMTFYRRLAKVMDTAEIQDIGKELADRFGPLPQETKTLLEKILLKVLCKKLGIARLELGERKVVFSFSEKTGVTTQKVMELIQQAPKRFRLTSDYVLQADIGAWGNADPLDAAKKVLQDLAV